MIDYGIFEAYQPDDENPIFREVPNALFARSASGVDWYDLQRVFTAGTVKLLVSADGVIASADRDVSRLAVPIGFRVVEIELPLDVSADDLRSKRFVAGVIVPPEVDLVAYAKDASWRKEIGGITFAGIQIATDDRSKLMITGARVAAMSDPNWTTRWDAADDTTHEIDAPTMIAISEAVSAHVNNCFAIRAAVKAGIAANPPTITTTAQIDAAFA